MRAISSTLVRLSFFGALLATSLPAIPQGYRVETTTSPLNGGTSYAFRLVFQPGPETDAVKLNNNIWQWGFHMPMAPLAYDSVETPTGWKWRFEGESGLFSFYTEGDDGWGTGDFGAYTVPQNGTLSGFTLWSPYQPVESVVQAFDINWNREPNLANIPGAPSALVTLQLADVFGATDGIPFKASLHRPGDAGALNWESIPLHQNKLRVPIYPTGSLELRLQGGTWLAKRLPIPSSGGDVDLGTVALANGDVNGDNTVNIADFLALRTAFGSTEGTENWNPNADLNRDGSVNIVDFLVLRKGFGQSGDA